MTSITTRPIRSSPPSETGVPPSGPEQAAAGPGDVPRVEDPNVSGTSPTSPTGRIPWKDQVVAFAKKTRGTIFRKEHGDQILAGEASAQEPTRKD
ncbi:hypothetical protein F5888DRAFT_1068905 [Russula emetica]|nr:hypothetical protein F5888DRAFT_1068905 [Russula emetica]